MNKKALYFSLILIIMLFIAFPIGLNSYDCISENNLPFEDINNFKLFFKILLNNLGFCVLILLGSISLNITTAGILFYTGYTWGIQFALIKCKYGSEFLTQSIIYHFPLEFLWIIVTVYLSSILSIHFYNVFNDFNKINLFFKTVKSTKKHILLIVILNIISALIETYIH